jgi:ABC-type Fe3+/spermidine/putrescine transport system ATPase subunit
VADGERIQIPATTGATVGSRLTAAVRPERVRVRQAGAADDGAASRLDGSIGLVVYLGTITQFHVDTSLGPRLIAHVLSGDEGSELRDGDKVVLSWDREDGAILREVGG